MEKYLKILGLSVGASSADVKKAYRQLAKQWHPDRFHHSSTAQQEATQRFQQINEAYQFLITQIFTDSKEYNSGSDDSPFSQAAIKVEKISPEFYYNLGVEYAQQGRDNEAIEAFNSAIRCDTNFLKAYQYRGFLLEKLGFAQRAQADFTKVLEIKSGTFQESRERSSSSTFSSPYPTNLSQESQQIPKRKTTFPQDSQEKKSSSPSSPSTDPSQKSQSVKKIPRWKTVFISNADIVTAVAVNAQGTLAAVGYESQRLYLWNIAQRKQIASFKGHKKAIRHILFSTDQTRLFSGDEDGKIYVHTIDGSSSKLLGNARLQHSQTVSSLALTSDGKILISGSNDKTVKIWFLEKNLESITLTGAATSITAVAIHPNNQYFVIGSLDNNIRLRNLENGKLIRSIPVNGSVSSLAISPDGSLLAVGSFGHLIYIVNLDSGEIIQTLEGHQDLVSNLIFGADSQNLISTSWDHTIKEWIWQSGECTNLGEHKAPILSAKMSKVKNILVTGGRDKRIGLWHSV